MLASRHLLRGFPILGHRYTRSFSTVNHPAAPAVSSPEAMGLLERLRDQADNFGVDWTTVYDPWPHVDAVQTMLSTVHEITGSSWVSTICLVAVGFRALTLYFNVRSIEISSRRQAAMVELLPLAREVRTALNTGDNDRFDRKVEEYRQELSKHGIGRNPFQGMGFLFGIQTPWIITLFAAIRGMATHPDVFRSVCLDSNFLWCPSLMLADPYGILPLASSVMAIAAARAQMKLVPVVSDPDRAEWDTTYFNYGLQGAVLLFLPFAVHLPAGCFIFVMCNTVMNAVVNIVVKRRLHGKMTAGKKLRFT
ncbi:Cytochrome c oxidase assembly protein cox18, mitochondrial [Perkinsus chesapeaki]|uniref:Cytochrome c oxidase assembly protein cox18, mitochondrial n=1 Tax=Perkinsus chesapeaki TaxID=330153 RepID=A0A7J6MYC6_PERCH|nr:Cytochrome c oxidase assembly protein cox18, mitochondrial [Perkinsus chesapeaki]